MSSYAAWSARNKQQTQGSVKTPSRAARNEFRLVGMVLSLFKREKRGGTGSAAIAASGSVSSGSSGTTSGMANKPKWDVALQLGSLQNNPGVKKEIVDATERSVREFEIVSKPSATNKIGDYRGELPKIKKIYSYDVLHCSVSEEELQNANNIQPGDLVEVRGINFSNWYSKLDGSEARITTYCNIDKIQRVTGAERSNFAYDLFMESGRPVRRIALETPAGSAGEDYDPEGQQKAPQQQQPLFKAKLGKETYAINYFGSDGKTADAYMTRPEYELYQFDFDPKNDPNNPQKSLVTYRPDVFNKAGGGGFVVENGFKTIATGTQRFADGSTQEVLAWLKLQREHVAPFGVSDEQTWNSIARCLLEQSKYTVLVKENLDRTANESYNTGADEEMHDTEGVDFKLAASVQTMLTNMPAEIERIGVRVPADHLPDLMGQLVQQQPTGSKGADIMLASPMHEGAYHTRAGRTSVLSLNEWSGNLTELITKGDYNFYIVTDLELDEANRELLNNEPVDKHYLIFDPRFRAAINKEKGSAAKLAAAKKFGLSDETEMIQLAATGAQAKVRVFYAVLKPELRASDYLERAAFVEAVRLYVPDPEATLKRLREKTLQGTNTGPSLLEAMAASADEKQGTKRAADKEAGDDEVKPKTKRAKKGDTDEPSASHPDSVDETPASPARKGGKKHKH